MCLFKDPAVSKDLLKTEGKLCYQISGLIGSGASLISAKGGIFVEGLFPSSMLSSLSSFFLCPFLKKK